MIAPAGIPDWAIAIVNRDRRAGEGLSGFDYRNEAKTKLIALQPPH